MLPVAYLLYPSSVHVKSSASTTRSLRRRVHPWVSNDVP